MLWENPILLLLCRKHMWVYKVLFKCFACYFWSPRLCFPLSCASYYLHSCILKPEERQKPQEPYMWWTFKSVTLCNVVSKACRNERDPCSPENAPADSRYYARPQLCAKFFKLFDLIIL